MRRCVAFRNGLEKFDAQIAAHRGPDLPDGSGVRQTRRGIGRPAAEATPTEGEAGIWATRFLTRFHYKPTPLDDAMSEQIYKRYLDSLDSDKLFFTQGDLDKFAGYQDK